MYGPSSTPAISSSRSPFFAPALIADDADEPAASVHDLLGMEPCPPTHRSGSASSSSPNSDRQQIVAALVGASLAILSFSLHAWWSSASSGSSTLSSAQRPAPALVEACGVATP